MHRPRVFVTRHLPGRAIDFLREHADTSVWDDDLPPARDELVKQTATSQGLLTLLTDRIDEAVLEAAPDLLVISNMATGFDNIDLGAASRRGVLVTRTPGVLNETTAEFTIGLIFAAARRIVEGDSQVRAGDWKTWGPETLLGLDLSGSRLGIIGMGGIGEEVAKRGRALGMRVIYHSRTRKPEVESRLAIEFGQLEELLSQADVVTLHAPLTTDTGGLINRERLAMMKRSAILVNTARGSLVDHTALFEALQSGGIAAAALDVTDPEPLPAGHPLLTLRNVIVTPHIASASVVTRSRMAMLAAKNLIEALDGKVPKNAVNRDIEAAWGKRLQASR